MRSTQVRMLLLVHLMALVVSYWSSWSWSWGTVLCGEAGLLLLVSIADSVVNVVTTSAARTFGQACSAPVTVAAGAAPTPSAAAAIPPAAVFLAPPPALNKISCGHFSVPIGRNTDTE